MLDLKKWAVKKTGEITNNWGILSKTFHAIIIIYFLLLLCIPYLYILNLLDALYVLLSQISILHRINKMDS